MTNLGAGIYTLSEAARLTGAHKRSVDRWLYGYSFPHKTQGGIERHSSRPLWNPQYSYDDFGEKVIGFRDLLELRVIREFIKSGVSLLAVRRCFDEAKRIFGLDYPFTSDRFLTDGKTIYHQAITQYENSTLLDLKHKQFAFKEIIKSSLYAGIEYEGNRARRWFPEPRSRTVVIDPSLQFGKPTIEESGVPTATLYASFLVEDKNKATVARLFNIPTKHVEAAVRFEEKLAA